MKRDLVYGFISRFVERNGYSPTVREIADGLGISTSTAYYHLTQLRDEGRISYKPGMSRTIKLGE